MTKPFMKWVGGKTSSTRAILAEIARLPWMNGSGGRFYYEPFVGGGAVFFAVESTYPDRVHGQLSDALPPVVDAWRGVQRAPLAVATVANAWSVDAETYSRVAAETFGSEVERAARVLYLQHCGFNGLWRESQLGRFNTPWGRPSSRSPVVDVGVLTACSYALRHAAIRSARDFAWVGHGVPQGSLVYLDPPYVPVSAGSFTRYGGSTFGPSDHARLSHVVDAIAANGSWVLLSNSGGRVMEHRFRRHRVVRLNVRRNVACRVASRGEVPEILVVAGPGVVPGVVEAFADDSTRVEILGAETGSTRVEISGRDETGSTRVDPANPDEVPDAQIA